MKTRRKTNHKRLLSMLLVLMMALAMLPTVAFAAPTDVVIDAANFPNETFRNYVRTDFDTNDDGILTAAEIAKVDTIDIFHKEIDTLKGVEFFTALTDLSCEENQLTSLDISNNTRLRRLYCEGNQLTSLDVSKNTMIEELECYRNQLISLDVNYNPTLRRLRCEENQLISLDVSKNTKLTNLECSQNQLTSLDVSKNTKLTNLECSQNQLTSLDVTKNIKLKELDSKENQLTSLDVSKNTELTNLECSQNQLTSLDVGKNTELHSLDCDDNQLDNLDVSKNMLLLSLDCSKNRLTSLDVSKNMVLRWLGCASNQLTSLDVKINLKLQSLNCAFNQLTSLDVSNNIELRDFLCASNKLLGLDVNNNKALFVLECQFNQLTSLDVSKNMVLERLDCASNQLTSLDVSKNTELEVLMCNNNSRAITLLEGKTFDLSTFPSLDVSKASNFVGGTVSGNILTATADKITYEYNCGFSAPRVFTLTVEGSTPPAELTFADNPVYDVPAGTQGTIYTVTTELTATGGIAPYTFRVDPAVTGLSINASNQLVFTRPAAGAAKNATIKVTDSASVPATKTITIEIGAVSSSKYVLTVTNGTGSGSYESGDTVRISADAAPAGQKFKNWTVETGTAVIADVNLAATTVTMTAGAATVKANYEVIPATEYTIHFNVNGGSGFVADQTTTGKKLTSLPAASKSGSYTFDGWYTAPRGGTKITTSTVFSGETTVYAQWTYTGSESGESSVSESNGGSGSSDGIGAAGVYSYTLTFDTSGGSDISSISKKKGTIVDLTGYEPAKSGYDFDGWYDNSRLINKITSVKLTSNTTVYAKWTAKSGTSELPSVEIPSVETPSADMPFADVPDDAYYKDAVVWAVGNGITEGINDRLFSPDGICTRAQASAFLWRASGFPVPDATVMPFNDVSADSYYYNAVLWAVEQGIIKGTSATTFSPDMNCSRAHIVAMLWRADGSSSAAASNPFVDVRGDDYFADAVMWAVDKKVTEGTSSMTFSPDDNCTRAQIVTFIYRNIK